MSDATIEEKHRENGRFRTVPVMCRFEGNVGETPNPPSRAAHEPFTQLAVILLADMVVHGRTGTYRTRTPSRERRTWLVVVPVVKTVETFDFGVPLVR